MRSPLIGKLRGLACLAALLCASPLAADPLDLTLDQARHVARQAFAADEFALSNALARRLLEADPKDPQTLLLLAATEPKLGNPTAGRSAGRRAWAAAAKMPALRYEIARYTALAAFQEGRPALAQFWLRRAADTAPTPETYRQTTEDFAELRNRNPLRFGFDLAVTPSSNLNRGAKSGLLIINDSLVVGPLSGSSKALSGVRTTLQARLSYALPPAARSRTALGLRFYGTINTLSATAKHLAPDLSGSALDQYSIEASLDHDVLLPNSQRPINLGFAVGQSFATYGALGPHLRLEAGVPLVMGPSNTIALHTSLETQWQDSGTINAASIALTGTRQDQTGGRFGWSITASNVQGAKVNQTYRSITGDVSYALGKPLGPLQLSAKLSAGLTDYPAFILVYPIAVTNGRQDQEVSLSIDMVFNDIGFWGYAPKLSLTAEQVQSNISRFETTQLGVTFGFESKF